MMPPAIPSPQLRIACQQVAPQVGEAEHNRSLVRDAIQEALAASAGLVVLPELATSSDGFNPHDASMLFSIPPAFGYSENFYHKLCSHTFPSLHPRAHQEARCGQLVTKMDHFLIRA
jgi:predicted amidohydrolase